MSLFLLIFCSLIVSALTYFLLGYSAIFWSGSEKLIISLSAGSLAAGLLFFVTRLSTHQESGNVELFKNNLTQSQVIKIGTSGDFPPFTFIKDNELLGFDVDLIKEIGQRLNKQIELKNMPFGTLLASLQLGTIDVIASGLTETPERAEQVLFTKPYLENNPLVIVSLNSAPAKSMQDLNGKEVVVNEGYTADLYMSKIKGPLVKRLKSPAQAFLALQFGRAFAFVTAHNTLKPFFDSYSNKDFHVVEIPQTEESASLAVNLNNPKLLKEMQEALDSMKHDGALQKLKDKWGL